MFLWPQDTVIEQLAGRCHCARARAESSECVTADHVL